MAWSRIAVVDTVENSNQKKPEQITLDEELLNTIASQVD
jgi:hypothetical protein